MRQKEREKGKGKTRRKRRSEAREWASVWLEEAGNSRCRREDRRVLRGIEYEDANETLSRDE